MRWLKSAVALGISVAVVAAAAALVEAQGPKPPRRVALLVGINEYQRRGFDSLRWAENDVNETAVELRRLGFDRVVTMTGSSAGELRPSRANIDAQLNRLLADVGRNDVVLVMLCGHGQQLPVTRADGTRSEDGFFCPIDAAMNEPSTMVSLSRLTDETLHKFGGRNLVLVDACRDGVVDRDRSVRTRGIQGRVVSLPEGTAVLFSCAAGQKSLERDDLKHGAFTYSLLSALRAGQGPGVVTWSGLVDGVQNLMADLNVDQEPIAAGAIGRLVLGTRAGGPVVGIPQGGNVSPGGPDSSKGDERKGNNAPFKAQRREPRGGLSAERFKSKSDTPTQGDGPPAAKKKASSGSGAPSKSDTKPQ